MIEGSIYLNIAILNVYVPKQNKKTGAAKYVKQNWTETRNRQVITPTVIVGDFNILLSMIDRANREEIGKDIELNNTINWQFNEHL